MKAATCAMALVLAASPRLARADEPSKVECVDAYMRSQELSRAGELTKARVSALLCARDPCPPVLQKDCVGWLADIDSRMPTIVVGVKDAGGQDVVDARVRIDGVEVASRIDGHALEIDPGEHRVVVEPVGSEPVEQVIVAREGDKGRILPFKLEKVGVAKLPPDQPARPVVVPILPPAPPPPPPRHPLPWTFWTAGGVGVVAAGTFAVFGVRGLVQRSDLDSCRPYCDADRIDRAKTSFVVADVSLVVAVVAAGVSTWILLTHPRAPVTSASR
jgi:hypothetical protein